MQWIIPSSYLREKIKTIHILMWLWNYSGASFIYHKFIPFDHSKVPSRPPSTGFIWVIGIYFTLFGIASQRYENRIDRIESRANGIYSQLGSKNWKAVLERIPDAQKMLRPQKPYLIFTCDGGRRQGRRKNGNIIECFLTVFHSFFSDHVFDAETVNALKGVIVSFKDDLSTINLDAIDLSGANLTRANLTNSALNGANLVGADLYDANLRGASFSSANFYDANLDGADFSDANFFGVNLQKAHLSRANFHGARLSSANLLGADLVGANLSGADFSSAERLTQEQIDTSFVNKNTKLPDGIELKLSDRTKGIRGKNEIYKPLIKRPGRPTRLNAFTTPNTHVKE